MSKPTANKPGEQPPAATPPGDGEALPDAQPDLGIITSGSCATPEDQEAFDRDQAGKPPAQS